LALISIVGGGIAGLLVARELARHGYSVKLFEEHEAFGIPRHCTGLVSEFTFKALGRPAHESKIMKFHTYGIATCDLGEEIELLFNEPVYLLDRELLEKVISEEALSLGADLKLRTYVRAIKSSGEVEVLGNHKEKYDYVVLAEGAIRRFSRELGMCPKKLNNLRGLQAIVKIKKLTLGRPLIITCSKICKDFFAWVVPYSDDGSYIVGVASRRNVYSSFIKLLKLISRRFSTEVFITKYFGGLIPIDKPCALTRGNVLGVGDSISLTKPISGGGIYSIVLEVKALINALKDSVLVKSIYCEELSKLYRLITLQYNIKKFLTYVGGYEKVVRIMLNLSMRRLVISSYDSLELDLAETARHLLLSS